MLKQKVVALCAAVVMSSAVLADDLSVQPVSNVFDESKVFHLTDNQSLNAVELSETEMKETEGQIAPWIIGGGIGATAGGVRYAYGVWKGDYEWDSKRFAGNVASGAVIGATFGAAGAAAGGGVGAAIWGANGVILNNGVDRVWQRDW